MVTRVKLKSERSIDNIVIGIVSQEPDYKLSLAINRKMGFSLKSTPPVIVDNETENGEISFSKFSFSPPHREISYSLVANRYESSYLLKKLTNIDYLFIVHNSEEEIPKNDLIEDLRKVDCITAVFNISLDQLKDKNSQYIDM